jgi:flagellar hook assembly protein FlgD
VTWTFTPSPTFTDSPTISPTPVPVPFLVNVQIFNSAGELVRSLYQGPAAAEPQSLSLSETLIEEGVNSATLSLGASSLPQPSWNGQNSAGQYVAGGAYYFKVDVTNAFGQVSSLVQDVQVIQAQLRNTLQVYNNAGEVVGMVSLTPLAQVATSYTLKSAVLAFGNGGGSSLQGTLTLANGATQGFTWNGESLSGSPLAPGTYSMQLVAGNAGGSVVQSKSITIVSAPDAPIPDPVVCPNPATASEGGRLGVVYSASQIRDAEATLYDLAGERASSAQDAAGSGTLWLDVSRRSSGVYWVVLRGRRLDGDPYVKAVKAALVR